MVEVRKQVMFSEIIRFYVDGFKNTKASKQLGTIMFTK
jgi:hypothetical protein